MILINYIFEIQAWKHLNAHLIYDVGSQLNCHIRIYALLAKILLD